MGRGIRSNLGTLVQGNRSGCHQGLIIASHLRQRGPKTLYARSLNHRLTTSPREGIVAILFEIKHDTGYKYANPVTFGTHRAMFLPRPAARGRLLSWSAKTSLASSIRWVSDGLSNNVTVMEFSEPGKDLTFTFQFRGIH